MTNSTIVNDFLEALDQRANQVGGLNGGQPYIIEVLSDLLKQLDLQEYKEELLRLHTAQLKSLIESDKEFVTWT